MDCVCGRGHCWRPPHCSPESPQYNIPTPTSLGPTWASLSLYAWNRLSSSFSILEVSYTCKASSITIAQRANGALPPDSNQGWCLHLDILPPHTYCFLYWNAFLQLICQLSRFLDLTQIIPLMLWLPRFKHTLMALSPNHWILNITYYNEVIYLYVCLSAALNGSRRQGTGTAFSILQDLEEEWTSKT